MLEVQVGGRQLPRAASRLVTPTVHETVTKQGPTAKMATPASVTEAESKNINAALRLLGTIPQAIPMSVAAPLAEESSPTWHRHYGQAKDAMREMQRRRLTLLQDKSWAAEETLARSHDYWKTVTNWLKYSKAPHIHRLWKDITTTHGTCDAAAIADTLTYIFNNDVSDCFLINSINKS